MRISACLLVVFVEGGRVLPFATTFALLVRDVCFCSAYRAFVSAIDVTPRMVFHVISVCIVL